jgi:hypothetical protein
MGPRITNANNQEARRDMSTNTLASALAAARRIAVTPAIRLEPARAAPGELLDVDALQIALQRSARTVDDIVTRRMLLASGCSPSLASR